MSAIKRSDCYTLDRLARRRHETTTQTRQLSESEQHDNRRNEQQQQQQHQQIASSTPTKDKQASSRADMTAHEGANNTTTTKLAAASPRRALKLPASHNNSNNATEGHNRGGNCASGSTDSNRVGETTDSVGGGSSRLVFGLGARTNKMKHDEYAEQRRRSQTLIGSNELQDTAKAEAARGLRSGRVQGERSEKSNSQDVGSAGRAMSSAASRPTASQRSDQCEQKPQLASSNQIAATTSDMSERTRRAATSSASKRNESQPDGGGAGTKPEESGGDKGGKVRRRSIGRQKSKEEESTDIEKKKEPSDSEQPKSGRDTGGAASTPRRQFNVLPPPQLSMRSAAGRGSVVSYAKSCIYDKQSRVAARANGSPTAADQASVSSESSALFQHDAIGNIPKSILSGFKPPKQVNVSKAREKWEGGEPFAKCKSRQRLAAAQAGKRLLMSSGAGWSMMTSVVATQQLQLQQALAQSSAAVRSNLNQSDPSVKILTRGSVLERVQQYERAPDSPPARTSLNSNSLSRITTVSEGEHAEATLALSGSAEVVRADATEQQNEIATVNYKSRVSSIQQQQKRQELTDSSVGSTIKQQVPAATVATSLDRLTSRRRSSVASITGANSKPSAYIPKFYHPNGKPNTYEIEQQKKNIVACFDTFPDRRAQLTGPHLKKHFHSIALACGFSEYLKVPLHAYVKHQLEQRPSLLASNSSSRTQLNGVVTSNGVARRSSIQSAPLIDKSVQLRRQSTIDNPTGPSANGIKANGVVGPAANSTANTTTDPRARLARSQSIATPTESAIGRNGTVTGAKPKLIETFRTGSVDDQSAVANSTAGPLLETVSCEQFLIIWKDLVSNAFDTAARFIHMLTFGQRDHLLPDDFVPLIQSIIDDHPGLKFLRQAPDFHLKYIQTVIARIYFCLNKNWTGKLTLQELRQGNLLAVLQVLSQETDINQVTDYFSYEHFYVIYCKFWQLDQDHDLLLSKEDLAKHNDCAISSRIIDRIFASNIISRHIKSTGKMSYMDFVWFLIAEEDKKHPRSIEYWFRLMDLDGDGYISLYEMEYFYYEQQKRLELMKIESLPFLDNVCQILDLVNPKEKSKISLHDLKRTKIATIFFDTFINLEKYLEHESREFVSTRDLVQGGVVISDWDKYASDEYENLVTEESAV